MLDRFETHPFIERKGSAAGLHHLLQVSQDW